MDKAKTNSKDRQRALQKELLQKPLLSPQELHKSKLLPVSLNGIYEACKSGDIQCSRIGGKIVIPTAPLRKKFSIEAV